MAETYNDKITIFATMNGVEGSNGVPSVSGGDVRIITILKKWAPTVNIILSTTTMGEKLARSHGLDADFRDIRPPSGTGIYPNLVRVFKSIVAMPGKRASVSYSGGEHLYDVVVPALMKFIWNIPWVSVVHWVEEVPWKDARGGTPLLHRYLYWLNRVLAMWLIKAGADTVLAVSNSTRAKLISERRFDAKRVHAVYCGLDIAVASTTRRKRIQHAPTGALFMKRLNYGKGVRDLIDIWALVVSKRPSAQLKIAGDGPPGVVDEIRARIARHGIEANVDLIGVVHDQLRKQDLLASAAVFALPSHEENWAIVIGEALSSGLPVIAYNLKEIVPLWDHRVTWIPFGDIRAFADAVIKHLDAPGIVPLDDFLTSLDWNAIAAREYDHVVATAAGAYE